MGLVFNPFTCDFDYVGTSGGGGSSFDPDTILTGTSNNLRAESDPGLEVLVDSQGNVLVGA